MDGGSTDGTVDILRASQGKIAYWESKPDRGIYHAWNKALERSTGDWTYFLGADDFLWSKDVFERIAPSLAASPPRVPVVYGQLAIVNEQAQVLAMLGEPWSILGPKFPREMALPHQATFHRRCVFQHGGFDESFRVAGDYELLLRVLKQEQAQFIPDLIVAGKRLGGVSSKPESMILGLREMAAARRKNGLAATSWAWRWAVAKVILRLLLIRLIGAKNAAVIADRYREATGKPAVWTR